MKLLRNILIMAVTALLLNSIMYYKFTTAYTKHVFREDLYNFQYSQSVYKHRLLGKVLVLETYRLLKDAYPGNETISPQSDLRVLGEGVSKNFYDAYFIVNTGFLVLCSSILVIIFSSSITEVSEKEQLLFPLFILSIICISQFVIVPYDIASYFFILAVVYSCFLYSNTGKKGWLFAACILVFISAFNRETGILAIALFASWLFTNPFNRYYSAKITGLLFLCFIVPYSSLRTFTESGADVLASNIFSQNFTRFENLQSILFWIVMFTVSYNLSKKENKRSILLFHFFSIPYILICFISGILAEIRLYIPLLIGSFILGQVRPGSGKKFTGYSS